jgi:hypothetical protein
MSGGEGEEEVHIKSFFFLPESRHTMADKTDAVNNYD